MALYRYVKTPPGYYSSSVISLSSVYYLSGVVKFLPGSFILIGLFLILLVVYPMFSYKLTLWRWQRSLVIPIPEQAVAEAKGFVSPLSSKVGETLEPEVIDEVDYSLIANWFPTVTVPPAKPSRVTHYTISVPKLKIEQATVTIGGKRLFDSLIQYPGTALPGEYGNTVIFGHSVLPTFYNPKDYKAIFSLIPTLEKGDKIFINFDGMEFTYLVEDYFEVRPEEVDVLQQRFDQQLLSLVTCVPPGTYFERGIIQARLAKI